MREFDMDDPENIEYVVKNCAAALVRVASNSVAGNIVVQVNEVSQQGSDSWLVSVERLPSGMTN